MKFTFWSNSTSLYNILKFVTNAQKSWSTAKISFLFLYTESQTIIWNSIFSATLLYNKSCQAFNIFQNWINNIKEILWVEAILTPGDTFKRSHTWTNAIVTRFRSLCLSFARRSSKKCFRNLNSMIFSHTISASFRAISDLPFSPLAINWIVFKVKTNCNIHLNSTEK